MDIKEIRKHWYAFIYDYEETQTDDIDFLQKIIGNVPKNILEVCCGTGRILAPLAKSGHKVTGLDIDEYMLERISAKINGLNNIHYYRADAVNDDWIGKYDIIILAGNIMMNIETDGNYEEAQKAFIKKASTALINGGYIYLDFNLDHNLEDIIKYTKEWVIFEGTDDNGVYGKFIMCNGGTYNKSTQMNCRNRRIELTLKNGEKDIYEYTVNKRIPSLMDIKKWLKEYNFVIEQEYGNYVGDPISEKTNRAIIYAKKI
jgi:SAM-dependent methyltransferase